MKKAEAFKLLGGDRAAIAAAVGVTVQAISAWPDELPPRIRDRVQAALWRRSQAQEGLAAKPLSEVACDIAAKHSCGGPVQQPERQGRRGAKADNRQRDYPIPPELDLRKSDRRGGDAQGAGEGV